MNRTIDDLRDTLAAHVRDLPPSSARTVAVRRRVRRIRRQRATAGALAVVLVAGAAALGMHADRDGAGQTAAGKVPEYANGGRLAATADIDSRTATSAQGSFVATSDTLIVTQRGCTAAPAQKLLVEILVNGGSVGSSSCEANGTSSTTMQPGIANGQHVTVTARLVVDDTLPTPITEAQRVSMPRTQVQVAFYQPVSRADYRFPPRPAKLADFPPVGSSGAGDQTFGSNDGGGQVTVDVRQGLDVEITSRAPGVITLDLDGHKIGLTQSWDYAVTTSSVRMTPHQLAAIGVAEDGTAQYATLLATGTDVRAAPRAIGWQVRVLTTEDPAFSDHA